jgi:glycerol-3-phosphate dehydrogenase (NAD(P)+)
MTKLSIIGAGAWGSAVAIALSDKFEQIFLHTHTLRQTKQIKHPALPTAYPNNINFVFGFEVLSDIDNILIATPSYGFTDTLTKIAPYLKESHQIAWLTKGFDVNNLCFLHQSFEKILPKKHACVISGPSFAYEVSTKKPTALVVASKDSTTQTHFANLIQTQTFRAYTSEDVLGVELGGALKNVLAIAAGIASGLGFGANTQAALITRSLIEMSRLGIALGAKSSTFVGLSGLGDLTLTCSDDLSRNRQFGKALALYGNTSQALASVKATVEGLNAIDFVLSLASKYQIEMPICIQIGQVIQGKATPKEAVTNLMSRAQIDEY